MKLVDGKNVYIQDFSGNVVKVTTNASTEVDVTSKGTVSDLKPGTSVIVQGTASTDGTSTAATSISQSSGLGNGAPVRRCGHRRRRRHGRWVTPSTQSPLRAGPAAVLHNAARSEKASKVSVRARLVLSTLCVFNAIVLLVPRDRIVGRSSTAERRYVLAAAMWIAAILLFRLSHGLRRGADWP